MYLDFDDLAVVAKSYAGYDKASGLGLGQPDAAEELFEDLTQVQRAFSWSVLLSRPTSTVSRSGS